MVPIGSQWKSKIFITAVLKQDDIFVRESIKETLNSLSFVKNCGVAFISTGILYWADSLFTLNWRSQFGLNLSWK